MDKQIDESVRKPSTSVVKMWRGVLRNQEDLPGIWGVLRDRTVSSDSANPPDRVCEWRVNVRKILVTRLICGANKPQSSTKNKNHRNPQ